MVHNSLARAGGRRARGRRSCARRVGAGAVRAPAGRGARVTLEPRRRGALDRRKLQRQSGLHAGGARLARTGRDRRARPAHRGPRRHAGARTAGRRAAPRAHRDDASRTASIWCFAAGPLMRALWEALPSGRRGGYAETSAPWSRVLAAIRAGDAVMVKGSLGSRMGPIVKALERAIPAARHPQRPPPKADEAARLMLSLYLLIDLSDKFVLNVFRYITFRTGGAMMTALVFVFLFGPGYRPPAAQAGQGPADPQRRAAIPLVTKSRHADHGRADDPVRHGGLDPAVGQSGQPLCLDRAAVTLCFGALGFYDDYLKVTKQTHDGLCGRTRLRSRRRSPAPPASPSRASAAARSRPR